MTTQTIEPEPRATVVARRVRGLMGEQRISQAAVAGALGMTQQAFSRRITGTVEFGVGEVQTLAEFLGETEPYLYGFTNERAPRSMTEGPLYAIRDSNPEPAD